MLVSATLVPPKASNEDCGRERDPSIDPQRSSSATGCGRRLELLQNRAEFQLVGVAGLDFLVFLLLTVVLGFLLKLLLQLGFGLLLGCVLGLVLAEQILLGFLLGSHLEVADGLSDLLLAFRQLGVGAVECVEVGVEEGVA